MKFGTIVCLKPSNGRGEFEQELSIRDIESSWFLYIYTENVKSDKSRKIK